MNFCIELNKPDSFRNKHQTSTSVKTKNACSSFCIHIKNPKVSLVDSKIERTSHTQKGRNVHGVRQMDYSAASRIIQSNVHWSELKEEIRQKKPVNNMCLVCPLTNCICHMHVRSLRLISDALCFFFVKNATKTKERERKKIEMEYGMNNKREKSWKMPLEHFTFTS